MVGRWEAGWGELAGRLGVGFDVVVGSEAGWTWRLRVRGRFWGGFLVLWLRARRRVLGWILMLWLRGGGWF